MHASETAPLAGLRVPEISSFVAAPLGGLTLAQLGAEVIRIDRAGGGADVGRWPLAPSGVSLYWTGLNKGKRSVTLDFRAAESRKIVADLVAASGARRRHGGRAHHAARPVGRSGGSCRGPPGSRRSIVTISPRRHAITSLPNPAP